MKKIVLYNVEEELLEKYRSIEEFKDIKFSRVFDEDLDKTVNDLFELEKNIGNCEAFEKSYMIMSDISKDDLNFVNKILKKYDLEFNGIRVMKTQINKDWTLKALLKEVSEEHEIMTRIFKLRKLIISTNDMDLNKYEEPLSFGLKQALLNGYVLINSKDINIDKLDEAIANIKQFLKAMGENENEI